jgi:hypothetical protein
MNDQTTAFPIVFDAAFLDHASYAGKFQASGLYDPERTATGEYDPRWTATGVTTDLSERKEDT